MSVLERVKRMPISEFYHICTRLVKEMGFRIRNGVYRENTVVFDSYMPLPGGEMRYVIIFIRKDRFTSLDLEDLVDFDTLQIRWMIITTGTVDDSARNKIPPGMEITLMDGQEFEKLLLEFGIMKEEIREGSFLPSAGKLDEELEWATEFLNSGNLEKAMEHVDRALSIKITSRGMKLKARILAEMGRYDEAIELLKKVLISDVRDDEAWFVLGSVLESMGDEGEAEEAYGQCVRFNPRNLGCWLNRGNLLFSMEKYDEALLCYEKALEIRQDLPDVWNNRGVVLKHMGKYDEAMRSYNAALKYNPDFAQAYLNKAILFYEMRRYEEAENAVFEYLRREKSEAGYLLLANIYLKRQMPGKAEEMANKALKINPGSIEARKILRKIHGGKVKEVEEEVKRGIEDILSLLPEEELEGVRELVKEARSLADQGDFRAARDKLLEAREKLKDYVDERMMKNAIIEDILELSANSEEMVPENLDDLSMDELRALRASLITKVKRKGEEKRTKENLIASLERIREDMRRNNLLDEETERNIEAARNLIEEGKFTDAVEVLLTIGARVERKRLDEVKRLLVGDTRELLQDVGMEIPEDLEEMDTERIRELRARALQRLRGEREEKEKGEMSGSLGDMVKALTGGAMVSTKSIKDELIRDIRELSELTNLEIPENLDEMDLDDLKAIRRNLIRSIRVVREEREEYPRGFGHILLMLGKSEMLFEDLPEDEYLANARGIYHYERGEYDKAVEQFKRALAINPEFREAEFNLGMSLIKMGREEEGKIHVRRAGMEHILGEEKI